MPVGPPKINSNSTSITSSASALPVKTFVPSKKVVGLTLETPKTSVAKIPVKASASNPKALVVYPAFKANNLDLKIGWYFAPIADGIAALKSSLGCPEAMKTVLIAGLAI
ncbi:hypothetical protein D3C87_1842580 [compost metagenome]